MSKRFYERRGHGDASREEMLRDDVIVYRASDHPESNGRQPQKGDHLHHLFFDLDDGKKIRIEMGCDTWRKLRDTMLAELMDDDNTCKYQTEKQE